MKAEWRVCQKSNQYATKGQKHIARGTALGKKYRKYQCALQGQKLNYQCFCPYRAFCFYQSVHPGRCPGLWAYWAFSPYNWLLIHPPMCLLGFQPALFMSWINLLMLLFHHNRSTASCTIFAFLTAQNCQLNEQRSLWREILEFCACRTDVADIQTNTMFWGVLYFPERCLFQISLDTFFLH